MKPIIIDKNICHGKAHLKGTRIPVHIILDLLSIGELHQNILTAYPQRAEEDILNRIKYAAKREFVEKS